MACIIAPAVAQNIALSRYETCWALVHPFAALKVRKIGKRASAIYRQADLKMRLDAYASGGRLDAFRHVFYMAAFAQKVRVKKLRRLGRAHEKANYRQFLHAGQEEGEVPDSLSSVMDLRNNELGFEIGHTNKKLSLEELKNTVILKIQAGKAVILKRNKNGSYMDCANHVLNMEAFEKRWEIPKCLVPSDTAYED